MRVTDLLCEPHECRNYIIQGEAADRVVAAYRDILREAREAVPGIILTGGAVRDVFYGKPVKDLDFMTDNDAAVEPMARFLNKPLWDCLRNLPDATRAAYEGERSMVAAYETEDKEANLLIVKSIMRRVYEFPDSVSQCWTDGHEMYGTAHFMVTAMNRVIRVSTKIKPERQARLLAKYVDFGFQYGIFDSNTKEY